LKNSTSIQKNDKTQKIYSFFIPHFLGFFSLEINMNKFQVADDFNQTFNCLKQTLYNSLFLNQFLSIY